MRSKLQHPLRPLWVTQASTLPQTTPDFPDFHPIVLCTASRRVRGAEASEGGYIQGAADDHEAWSHGLTPPLFWSNKDDLLRTNEEDLPSKIAQLVSQERPSNAIATLIKPTDSLHVCASQDVDLASYDTVISCTPEPLPHAPLVLAGVKSYLHLPCQTGKLGSRDLRSQLPALHQLGSVPNSEEKETPAKTLICCPTGKDLSVGTALAYLCLYVDDSGAVDLQKPREPRDIDKTLIKQRLSWITTSNPALNPSRATLQSVNSVLMSSSSSFPNPSALPSIKNPAMHDSTWTPLPQPSIPDTASPPLTHAEHEPSSAPAPPPSRPETLFARLQTRWSFTRSLTSAQPTHPSGTVTGTAVLSPTPLPTTLLYAEEGTFTTTTGLVFNARRKYVYRLVEQEGEQPYVAVYFFDDEARRADIGAKGEGVGGLFAEMGELKGEGVGVLEAENRERHLCGEDLYAARWKVGAGMVEQDGKGGEWWEVRYDVVGPKKGYVSSTRYERVAE